MRSFGLDGRFRVFYAYFDGRLKIQYTETLNFGVFAVQPPPDKDYLDVIDLPKYHGMIDTMLKWAWPIIQGDTSKDKLESGSQ